MIFVKITGGLGNQLFQYAAGRALALRSSSELAIDDREYQTDGLRRYCLDYFETQGVVCSRSPAVARLLPPHHRKHWLSFLRWKCTHGRGVTYYREHDLRFDPKVLSLGPNTYLRGYWQSEHYFSDATRELRQELMMHAPPSAENENWLRDIAAQPSVSVHIRRGDYVSVAKFNRLLGTCPPEYYRQAAEHMLARLPKSPRFFVFSDDPEWTRQNIQLPAETRYVAHNDHLQNYEDLRLMAACDHHIVANSTFSWWGAWLGANPQKIVVAPARWFRDPSKNCGDLVPPQWIRL